MLAIRYTPLPWRWKWRLIWLGGPKVLFAACALIRDPEGRVLVLRSRYSGAWQFPGGCVRHGEGALEGLQRECREELGLEVRQPRLVGIFTETSGLSQCALYVCDLEPGAIRLSEEHTTKAYLDIDALPRRLRVMAMAATVTPSHNLPPFSP